ncbi:MAG TPA: hypothetical protein VE078_17055 [Thermoanaerobaculia bacterium]|nr:hypothetical protein [Thermoanaerobaculia bacterium]
MAAEKEQDDLDETSIGLRAELGPGGRLRQRELPMEEADYPRFQRLTFYSVLAGLCPLLPVAFLDDWIVVKVQRGMIEELGKSRDLGLSDAEVRLLSGEGEARIWPGLAKGSGMALRSGLRTVLRKIFKTAFYLLLIRDGVHQAVETFVQGYLFLHAAGLPQGLRSAGRTEERVRAVRTAVVETLREEDVKPIHRAMTRAFRRSFDLLLEGAKLLVRLRSAERASEGEALRQEERLLSGFVDRLAASLWGNEKYFEGLEKSFEERLARPSPR